MKLKNNQRILKLALFLVTVGYLLAGIYIARHTLGYFRAPEPKILKTIREDLDYGKASGLAKLENEGFIPGELGLYIDGNSQAKLKYTINKDAASGVTVYIRSYAQGAVSGVYGRWFLSYDNGKSYRAVDSRIRALDKKDFIINLLDTAVGKEEISLVFEAKNLNAVQLLALNWIEVRIVDRNTLAGSTYDYPYPGKMTAVFLLLFTPLLVLFRPLRKCLPLWFILLFGFYLRYSEYTGRLFTKLEVDPTKNMQYALQMKLFTKDGFYSGKCGVRGPLFPLVSKSFHSLLGSAEARQRLTSLFLSLAVVIMTYILAHQLFGQRIAFIIAFIISASGAFILESARGNRFELITLLILLLSYICLKQNLVKTFKGYLALVLTGGALGLCFSYSILGTAALLLITFKQAFGSRKAVFYALGGCLLIVLIVLPYEYRNEKYYGYESFRRMSYLMAKLEASGEQRLPFDKNIEINFKQTFDKEKWSYFNPQRDKGLTYFEYIFGLHKPAIIAKYVSEGMAKAMLWQGLDLDRSILLNWQSARGIVTRFKIAVIPIVIGVINLFCSLWIMRFIFDKWPYMAFSLAIILYLAPISFMLGWRIFEFPRYIMHIYPLFLLSGVEGIKRIWKRL